MPFLIRDDEEPENSLLLVHVPRCGGTSLAKHFHVERKARKGLDPYHAFGLLYFFYRYRCLERENFPFRTYENLLSLTTFLVAWIIYFAIPDWGIAACENQSIYCPPPVSVSLWVTSIFFFILSTFVMNAPVMGRMDIIRRFEMWFFGKILCSFSGTQRYLHGVNYDGYLMHYTAQKMLDHGFVTLEQMAKADAFAIVRNPYSRMVSIYMYNRYGSLESFSHFVRAWYKKWKKYKAKNSCEERDVYCHVLPQVEFTHHNNDQIIPYIIRQEDLKELTKLGGVKDPFLRSRYEFLSDKVMAALKGMPHTNKRVRKRPWHAYYTQETMDLVQEMYKPDFLAFHYDTEIRNRPDLVPKMKHKPTWSEFKARSTSMALEIESGLIKPPKWQSNIPEETELENEEIKEKINEEINEEIDEKDEPRPSVEGTSSGAVPMNENQNSNGAVHTAKDKVSKSHNLNEAVNDNGEEKNIAAVG